MANNASKGGDVGIALAAARAFQEIAQGVLSRLRIPLTQEDDVEIGELFVAATNYIFGCELLLKSIIMLDGKVAPHGHNLVSLFDKVSDEDRAEIELGFKKRMARYPHAVLSTEIMLLYSGNGAPPPPLSREAIDDNRALSVNLRRSLEATGDSYKVWRYLHEYLEHDEGSFEIRFCHVALRFLSEAAVDLCEKKIGVTMARLE